MQRTGEAPCQWSPPAADGAAIVLLRAGNAPRAVLARRADRGIRVALVNGPRLSAHEHGERGERDDLHGHG